MGGWVRHSTRRNVVVTSGEQHEEKSHKQNAGSGAGSHNKAQTKTKEKAEKIRVMRRMYLYLLIFNDTDIPVNQSTDIILFTGFMFY